MNNALIAKVLHSNGLATKEQIQKYWPQSTDLHDVGQILVEQGILTAQIYEQVISFVNKMNPAAEESPAPAETEKPKIRIGIGANPSPSVKPVEAPVANSPVESSSDGLAIEGNNPFGDGLVEESDREVETLEGLQETRLSDFKPLAIVKEAPLPNDWILETGEGLSRIVPAMVPGASSRLDSLLASARKMDVSDLLLTPGQPIFVKKNGILKVFSEEKPTAADLRRWVNEALDLVPGMALRKRTDDLCVSFAMTGLGRYRMISQWGENGVSISIRLVPIQPLSWQTLAIPEPCRTWAEHNHGLTLISGPSGSGITVALQAYALRILEKHQLPVHWISDPVEWIAPRTHNIPLYCYQPPLHAHSVADCIRLATSRGRGLIVVDQISTESELLAILDAVDGGWPVLVGCLGLDITDTLERLLALLTESKMLYARSAISRHLQGALCRQLRLGKEQRLVPCYEFMRVNSQIQSLLLHGEISSIPSAMTALKGECMLMSDYVKRLTEQGVL